MCDSNVQWIWMCLKMDNALWKWLCLMGNMMIDQCVLGYTVFRCIQCPIVGKTMFFVIDNYFYAVYRFINVNLYCCLSYPLL